MSTYFIVAIGALVGFVAHRWLHRSPFSRVDHTLIGSLTALLGNSLAEMIEIPVADIGRYMLAGMAGVAVTLSLTLLSKKSLRDRISRT